MTFQSITAAFRPKKIKDTTLLVFRTIYLFTCFFLMIVFIVLGKVFILLKKIPLAGKVFTAIESIIWRPQINKGYLKFFSLLEASRFSEVKRSYLINLALKNLLAKKHALLLLFWVCRLA